MQAYAQKTTEEILEIAKAQPPGLAGVEQSEEMLQWIWENFAAVAGDHPSFECWPSQKEYMLHEVLLAGWGCPIGELFDLEKLAEHCGKVKRWSFFVTSEVCNVSVSLIYIDVLIILTRYRSLVAWLVHRIYLPSFEEEARMGQCNETVES
jgi:hypothetical protein